MLMTLALPSSSSAREERAGYELSLSFSPGEESGKLLGTAKIDILPGQRLTPAFPQMEITGALLRDASGRGRELPDVHMP